MLTILILVIAALGCGFCLGRARRLSLVRRRPALPLMVVVRSEVDEYPLAEFLVRERRYLRLFGRED
jgi:hypothetical protein